MKKLTTLALMCCISFVIALSSCGTTSVQTSIISMFYRGAMHTYNSAAGMYIYQGSNYSTVAATESSASANTFYLNYTGTNTGTYTLNSSSSSAINMTLGGVGYSSQAFGGHGTVHMTKFDAGTMVATGDFTGTLYNTNTASDSLPITQGSISVKYQF
ncbi:MAG: hypothetical protein JWO03_761 [Bacteroidetes bacterium]|nr:hypothetical protein [Bacteroidota bacterium]